MRIVNDIKIDIQNTEGRKTKLFRDIAKSYKQVLSNTSMDEIYQVCDELLKTMKRPEAIVAYQILFDQKKRYKEETIDVFEQYLYNYIHDWWDCDDFMTHAFQYVLMKYPSHLNRIKNWVNHERFAVRRSAAVVLIVPAKKKAIDQDFIFDVCNLLMNDEHYLVQKGYGWLLKVASSQYHDVVIDYLEENVNSMTRTAYRYALENLPKEEKERLMKF